MLKKFQRIYRRAVRPTNTKKEELFGVFPFFYCPYHIPALTASVEQAGAEPSTAKEVPLNHLYTARRKIL